MNTDTPTPQTIMQLAGKPPGSFASHVKENPGPDKAVWDAKLSTQTGKEVKSCPQIQTDTKMAVDVKNANSTPTTASHQSAGSNAPQTSDPDAGAVFKTHCSGCGVQYGQCVCQQAETPTPPPSPTDTPETDAAIVRYDNAMPIWVSKEGGGRDTVVRSDFARTLERRLAAALARVAELEADKRRIDWLSTQIVQGFLYRGVEPGDEMWRWSNVKSKGALYPTYRAAIDAAMNGGAL